MKNKNNRKRVKNIISFFLSLCMISGFFGVRFEARAAGLVEKAYSSGQINWTENGLEVYNDLAQGEPLEIITDTANTHLIISGTARVGVQSSASGKTLGALTTSGTGSYFHVGENASVTVGSIDNQSSNSSNVGGIYVKSGGTLSCDTLSNTEIVQVNGTLICRDNFTNNGRFYDLGLVSLTGNLSNPAEKLVEVYEGATLNCVAVYNSGTLKVNGTLKATGSLFNENNATIEAGSASSISCLRYNDYSGSKFKTDGYFKCTESISNTSSAQFTSGSTSTLECGGIDNYGTFTAEGSLTCTKTIKNTNLGTFEAKATATVSANAITSDGTFTNRGTITVGSITGKIGNTGRNGGAATINCSGTINNTGGVSVYAGTLICENFTGTGSVDTGNGSTFTVNDTYNCTGEAKFLHTTISAGTFITPTSGYNSGSYELSAKNLTWQNGFSNSTTAKATDSLTFTGYDSSDVEGVGAPFTVGENTIINSDGAYFTLKAGSISKSIEGEVIKDKKASWAVKDEPTLTIGMSIYDNYYYGIDYNYGSKITTTSDGTPKITFKTATDSWGDEVVGDAYSTVPTKVGTYVMYVDVPETSTYRDVKGKQAFRIQGISIGSTYCTIEQTQSAPDFYNEPVTLVAPEGYLISPDDGETVPFASKYTLTEDGWYYGVPGVYKEISSGGKTDPSSAHGLYDGIFYIDQTPPEIVQDSAIDQDNNAITKTIEDGVTIKARKVKFTVKDELVGFAKTLKTVTVDGTSIAVDSDFGEADVELSILLPGKKTHKIVAEDEAGNISEWNITLEYLPTATPETPFTISGTEGKNGYYTSDITLIPLTGYTISADVNGTFTDSLKYSADIENVYLMDAIGLYTNPIPVSFSIDKEKPTFATAEDENGNKFEITDGLEVHAKKLSFSVSDVNLTTVTVNGEAVGIADGAALIELAPEAGQSGNYEVYAEDIAGNSIQAVVTVEYLKDVATATVSVENHYLGMKYEPVLLTNSDGKAEFYYKKEGSSDETYTTVKPDSIGTYYVQVRIPSTDHYTAVEKEAIFTISYLPDPQAELTITATEGKNDFYTSDVLINAPEGYFISDKMGTDYSKSVTYTEGMNKVYLMRIDGAMTSAIEYKETYKIDKLSPEVSKSGSYKNSKTQAIKNVVIKSGMSIFADTLEFSISDENLATITINGETVEFNEKTAKILLDANNKTSKFNIIAEDKAGNTSSLSIVLKAAWLENNIIPAGAKITLEAGQIYNLEGGKWTVSGDSTVYYGGNSFCVDGLKDCIFTEMK